MTADQLVLACIVHDGEWVDLTGMPQERTSDRYPFFIYAPEDVLPWGIDPERKERIREYATVDEFKEAAQRFIR